MRKLIINDDNLKKEEIDFTVTRVKGIIINSRGDILLCHNNNTYQLPGGHVDDNETLESCLKREIKEETGIDVKLNYPPIMEIITYDSNYFNTGKKVESKIYYFRVDCDEEPNFSETNYDELELETDFNLFYINGSNMSLFLKKCLDDGSIDSSIGREMLLVFEEYEKVYGGRE